MAKAIADTEGNQACHMFRAPDSGKNRRTRHYLPPDTHISNNEGRQAHHVCVRRAPDKGKVDENAADFLNTTISQIITGVTQTIYAVMLRTEARRR